jgi:dipeptidase E
MSRGHIIAMGGGGFSHNGHLTSLDHFVLNLGRETSGKKKPAICFIPTASGDAEGYIERFNTAFKDQDCVPTILSMFRNAGSDLEEIIAKQDIIYVGGGNTRNMLTIWRDWGLDKLLRAHWEQGKVCAGISAGSICWFEYGLTDSLSGELHALPCLGFLPDSNCPHYDGEIYRRPRFTECISSGSMPGGLASDDGAAVYFKGRNFVESISDKAGAKSYRLTVEANNVIETEIETRLL